MKHEFSAQKRDQIVERIKQWSVDSGITEDELGDFSFDVFPTMTRSTRILQLCRIAYYRGMGRAVGTVYESFIPITLPEWRQLERPIHMPFPREMIMEIRTHIASLANEVGVSIEDLHNWSLDGFSKLTKSRRIMRMCRLAYDRGWCQGIHEVYVYLLQRENQKSCEG